MIFYAAALLAAKGALPDNEFWSEDHLAVHVAGLFGDFVKKELGGAFANELSWLAD
jgi:hypothetical protein